MLGLDDNHNSVAQVARSDELAPANLRICSTTSTANHVKAFYSYCRECRTLRFHGTGMCGCFLFRLSSTTDSTCFAFCTARTHWNKMTCTILSVLCWSDCLLDVSSWRTKSPPSLGTNPEPRSISTLLTRQWFTTCWNTYRCRCLSINSKVAMDW